MRVPSNAIRKPPVDQQGELAWRFIDRRFDDQEKLAGPAICSRCHAFLDQDHWRYDEERYREMQHLPDIHTTLCPGCTRIERRLYEGEVIIHLSSDSAAKQDILHLIHNEEARARATNPTARIALLEDRGEELYILTTTQFLAKRLGRELEKAYDGSLKMTDLPRERFTRVRWTLL
ncbi:MAG TPA: hypothetical protein VGL77_02970 [Armatimonadota bacterium]|jgi:predicted Fe-S protein YdhL (DUF1289 family)